jgi:hypothetical protein
VMNSTMRQLFLGAIGPVERVGLLALSACKASRIIIRESGNQLILLTLFFLRQVPDGGLPNERRKRVRMKR